MREVGAYEAKTHLAALLEDVARGETIVITRRGNPSPGSFLPPTRTTSPKSSPA